MSASFGAVFIPISSNVILTSGFSILSLNYNTKCYCFPSDIRWSAILKVAICHNENRSSFISSQKVTINNFKVAKEHECIDFTASFLIDIFLTLLFLIMLSKISRKVTKFFLSGQNWFRHFELSSKVSHAKSIDIHVLMTLCTYLRILF